MSEYIRRRYNRLGVHAELFYTKELVNKRFPRITILLAIYAQLGTKEFTLAEARRAAYEEGCFPEARRFYSYHHPSDIQLMDRVLTDHWVIVNTNSDISTACRIDLEIRIRDKGIFLKKIRRGVYQWKELYYARDL